MQTKTPDFLRLTRRLLGSALAALLLVGCSADNGPPGAPGSVLTIGGFTATPSTVAPGGTTTLSYTTVGAVACTATSNAPGSTWNGSVPTSGNTTVTVPTTPGDYVYTLTCSDTGGQQTTQTETVRVPAPAGSAPVISTFTGTPTTVLPGGSTVLTYTTSGAESCTATSSAAGSTWTGSVPTSSTGTTVVAPQTPGNYSYALTCTNATGQQTTQFVTITVTGGNGPGDVTGGDILPNDGTVPTDVTDGGTPIAGRFVCTSSARIYGDSPTTTVTVNGLLGPALTDLLNFLGGGSVTQLLNSVSAKENVVDRNLDTFAQFNLTAGLLTLPVLGNLVSSVDLNAGLNSPVPVGKYAVFGLTFPTATVEATLTSTLFVTTFNGNTVAETRAIDLTALDLLGLGLTGQEALYVGLKTTQPYTSVSIGLDPSVLSANVGNAMNVHELCTDGMFITPP